MRNNNKIYWILSKDSPWKVISLPRDLFPHLKDLVIVLTVVKSLETSTSEHIRISCFEFHRYILHPPWQYPLLLPRPSTHRQTWELEQLHVVPWKFLEKQKLTGSSLSVWYNHTCSLTWIHTSLSFPSFLSRLGVPKKIKGHHDELPHYYSLIQ